MRNKGEFSIIALHYPTHLRGAMIRWYLVCSHLLEQGWLIARRYQSRIESIHPALSIIVQFFFFFFSPLFPLVVQHLGCFCVLRSRPVPSHSVVPLALSATPIASTPWFNRRDIQRLDVCPAPALLSANLRRRHRNHRCDRILKLGSPRTANLDTYLLQQQRILCPFFSSYLPHNNKSWEDWNICDDTRRYDITRYAIIK